MKVTRISRTVFAPAVMAAATVLMLTACEDGTADSKDPSGAVTAAPSSSAPSVSAEDKAKAREAAGLPPTPDASAWKAYIDDLNAVDRDIVHGKEEKAVSRGINQCSSFKLTTVDGEKFSRDKLVDLANRRFTSPDHPDGHGLQTAAKIVDIVHKRICPTF